MQGVLDMLELRSQARYFEEILFFSGSAPIPCFCLRCVTETDVGVLPKHSFAMFYQASARRDSVLDVHGLRAMPLYSIDSPSLTEEEEKKELDGE
jgi:hypothetical protein